MLRDRLRAATFIQGSQAINAEGVGNADVFALAAKGGQIGIQAFFIRRGQNWGHRAFFPSHTEGLAEEDVMVSFLAQFYEEVPPPRCILVDRALSEGSCWPRRCARRRGGASRSGAATRRPPPADRAAQRNAARRSSAGPETARRRGHCAENAAFSSWRVPRG